MKFTYAELLIILALIVVGACFIWSISYHAIPETRATITVHEDGPEMKKAIKEALK